MPACYVHEKEIRFLERAAKHVPLWPLLYAVAAHMTGDPNDPNIAGLQRLYEILCVGIGFLTTMVIGGITWETVKSVRTELKYVKDFYVDEEDYELYNKLGLVSVSGLELMHGTKRSVMSWVYPPSRDVKMSDPLP